MPVRQLRVLHVISSLSGGGAENLVSALVPRFNQQLFETAIMPIYSSTLNGPLANDLSGVTIIEIGRRGRFDAAFFARMVRAMRTWRPDIVHTHMHNGKYWGRLAAKASGVPIILYTEHNPCEDLRIKVERVVDRALNGLTDGIITFFEPQRQIIAASNKLSLKKIMVIPNGIVHRESPTASSTDEIRPSLGVHRSIYAIVTIARLQARKNQQLAIRMMAAIPPEVRCRTRLFIVGSGGDDGMLKRLATELRVDDSVVFTGNRSDVDKILHEADLFFLPSLAEGMPLAMLEAMSVGVPVLSTPWIGVHGLLEDGRWGDILPDWDSSTAASRIIAHLNDRHSDRAKARDAQAHVRATYNIDRTARLHEA